MRTHVIIALCAIAALTASGAAKGTLTLNDGTVLKGIIRWTGKKEYEVMEKTGPRIEKPKDVQEVNVEEPAALEGAIKQVEKGQISSAIPVLQKIVTEYAHLQWDKVAGRYLAEAYIAAEKSADALKVCADIIREEPAAAYRGDLAPAYWSALLSQNRRTPLETNLQKAEKGTDRFSRGAALIMRGDIALKDGNESVDACKKALTDGYLRVVFLYKDEEFAQRLQPEALYKAARCFDKLNQSGRADFMRTELKRSYASSPWANK